MYPIKFLRAGSGIDASKGQIGFDNGDDITTQFISSNDGYGNFHMSFNLIPGIGEPAIAADGVGPASSIHF